jgi:hypothetical protein
MPGEVRGSRCSVSPVVMCHHVSDALQSHLANKAVYLCLYCVVSCVVAGRPREVMLHLLPASPCTGTDLQPRRVSMKPVNPLVGGSLAKKAYCRCGKHHRNAILWSSKESRGVGPESPRTFALCHYHNFTICIHQHVFNLHTSHQIVTEDAEDLGRHGETVCAEAFGSAREASTAAMHLQHARGVEHNAQRVPSPF